MLRRGIRLLSVIALTGVAVLALGGCGGGGGGDLTLEEFFAELEKLDGDLEATSNELNGQVNTLTDSSSVEDFTTIIQQQEEAVTEFADGVEELDAPDEAKELQSDAVSAGRDAADEISKLVDSASDYDTLEELFSSADTTDLDAAFSAFDQVCHDAESLAAENNITVDLNCNEDGQT